MKWTRFIWIILGLFAFTLSKLFSLSYEAYENLYFRGIFPILRYLYDYTFGLLPIPMVYIILVLLIYWIAQLMKFKDLRNATTTQEKILGGLLPIASFLGFAYFSFYFCWGYNYVQKPLSDQLSFPQVRPDTTALYNDASFFLDKMNTLRSALSNSDSSVDYSFIPQDMELSTRASLTSILSSWDLPTAGRVRVRNLHPKGVLLRLSTAGVYIPFVFEGHVDAGLHPLQKPFVMAHEMSHGYGITDEGTCNFTGFLACVNNENEFVQYAGYVGVWRYMASDLRRYAPRLYKKMMKNLSPAVRNDLTAIYDTMDLYPDIMPKIRDKVYDTYLKTNGVQGGLSSYGTVVRLVSEWKSSKHNSALKEKIYTN